MSSIRLAIARSSRARSAFRNTKRAPDTFAADSKSIIPSASPSSKCCLGSMIGLGVPTLRTSTFACSSLPTGTSSRGKFGMTSSAFCNSASRRFTSSSPAASLSFSALTSAIKVAAAASSLFFFAVPISFDAALRRAWMSFSAVISRRRRSSRSISAAAIAGKPRTDNRSSNFSLLSRIHLMSNISVLARPAAVCLTDSGPYRRWLRRGEENRVRPCAAQRGSGRMGGVCATRRRCLTWSLIARSGKSRFDLRSRFHWPERRDLNQRRPSPTDFGWISAGVSRMLRRRTGRNPEMTRATACRPACSNSRSSNGF